MHRPPDDDNDDEGDNEVEDNDKEDDNNKDDTDDKSFSALALDRDLRFLQGHRGYQGHRTLDEDDKEEEDNNKNMDDNKGPHKRLCLTIFLHCSKRYNIIWKLEKRLEVSVSTEKLEAESQNFIITEFLLYISDPQILHQA